MSRRVELTRVYHFSAAHCLAHPGLSAADNATLYGQCARPHGHNYYLEVTVAGIPDALTGFAVDLERLDRTVARSLLDQVDHHRLEDVPVLTGVVTTGEGLAHAFWGALRECDGRLGFITAWGSRRGAPSCAITRARSWRATSLSQ